MNSMSNSISGTAKGFHDTGLIVILSVIIFALGCFGPFYTTLATYYVTDKKQDLSVSFNGYKIDIHVGAVQRDNRKPLEYFNIYLSAKSINKYHQPLADMIDTLNAIKIDRFCAYCFVSDSLQCPNYYKDSAYSIWKESGRILQGPTWGWYDAIYIPTNSDSIRVTFTATLYDDNSYTEIIDKKEFSEVLYRKYKKTIPITK